VNSGGSTPADHVFVAISGSNAIVRVEGRGSFKTSAALKQFGDTVILKRLPLMVIDMNTCIGMDSTFMGVLAGIASRMRGVDGRIALVNCTQRTYGLIGTLGLDQLIASYLAGSTPPDLAVVLQGRAPGEALASVSCKDPETMRTMIQAHETIVDLAPETLPQFKDVIQFLREEVSRKNTTTGKT